MNTCDKCTHVCDESCQSCERCYISQGDTICERKCRHAKHKDDGGFLIDGNHPDDMFGVGRYE